LKIGEEISAQGGPGWSSSARYQSALFAGHARGHLGGHKVHQRGLVG
jgi:hypothetical protein